MMGAAAWQSRWMVTLLTAFAIKKHCAGSKRG